MVKINNDTPTAPKKHGAHSGSETFRTLVQTFSQPTNTGFESPTFLSCETLVAIINIKQLKYEKLHKQN